MMLLDTAKRLKNFASHEFVISRCTLGQDIYTILFQDESTKVIANLNLYLHLLTCSQRLLTLLQSALN